MRLLRYNFLFVIGLVMTLGISSAFASGGDKKDKGPKDTGTLTVKTTPAPYAVRIDGKYAGMSGVNDPAVFYLAPGFHTVEVAGPNGTAFTKEIEIKRNLKHCICLKLIEETMSRPCPYNFHLEGPEKVQEGQIITFAAINSGTSPIPIRYAWRVSPGRITSGLGTKSITVDTTGMAGETINAELDVNDDVYDNKCKQVISVPTEVSPTPTPTPPPITSVMCDEFPSKSADDDKGKLDNCVIQVQNRPDAQLYVIIYPGLDRISMTRNTYDRLSKRALDYLVKNRGLDPRRISIVKGGTRARTSYEVWIVPPGAQPPVVR